MGLAAPTTYRLVGLFLWVHPALGTRVSRLIAQIPPVGQRERPLLSLPLGSAISGVYLLGAAHFKGWKTILSQ